MALQDVFIRRQQAKACLISTGDILLDRAFKIPEGKTLLLRGEKYSGCTGILLQLVQELLKDHIVFYVDPHNVWLGSQKHRWGDLENLENLFVLPAPSGVELILEVVNATKEITGKVWVLDGLNVMRQGDPDGKWSFKNNLHDIVDRIKRLDPKATIIYAENSDSYAAPGNWSVKADVTMGKIDYRDGIPIGHTITIQGPLGKSTSYIEYKRGRLSQAYQHAILEVEKGCSTNSVFELDGLRVKGFHEFIRQHNDTLIGSYDLQETS